MNGAVARSLEMPDAAHVAAVLRKFFLSPVSIAALQPVLELAVQFNPDLRGLPISVDLEEVRRA